MASHLYFHASRTPLRHRRNFIPKSSVDRKENPPPAAAPLGRPKTDNMSPMEDVFRRRLLSGVGSASLLAVGSNFAGFTSSVLGAWPETGRKLKLDVLYPIGGYTRCIETNVGFEFIYPSNWAGDQTLLYRAAGKAESQRSLDPPSLSNANSGGQHGRQRTGEPVVAFRPPGSSGELNVSVIVSPVPLSFSIDAMGGGPKDFGEAVVQSIVGSRNREDVRGYLVDASLKEDPLNKVKYHKLEFIVESPSFRRRNVAVCCAQSGQLFTLNAQAPESAWPEMMPVFYKIADSFVLT